MSLESILDAQRTWAKKRGIDVVRDYTRTLEDNLFHPLKTPTRAEFASGSGDELGSRDRRGKMQSLRSSSALAVNFFDHWRGRPLGPLAEALGGTGEFLELHFEQKYPHGLPGIPPNIDVVLYTLHGSPLAIESKFAEPYGKESEHKPIDPKYFSNGRRLWRDVGLPRCQLVADAIGHDLRFSKLDAGQLLKHFLGLARVHPDDRPVRLVYLWYDPRSEEAKVHLGEIEQFATAIGDEVEFGVASYNKLFSRIRAAAEPSYVAYLSNRYFAA